MTTMTIMTINLLLECCWCGLIFSTTAQITNGKGIIFDHTQCPECFRDKFNLPLSINGVHR